MKKLILLSVLLTISSIASITAFAWDGYNESTGEYIEIGKGNLVRSGQEIEIYNYNTGNYGYGEVESVNSYGSSVEVEIYNYESGEYEIYEMD